MNAPDVLVPAADAPAQDDRQAAVPLRKRVRRLVMQLGPSRMAATIVFLIIAVLIARFSWEMPLVNAAERALYDARASLMAPRVEQDKRITLVTYNDETLFNTGIRSPLDRTLLANALGNLDQMGAKAIGIDIAFDSPRPDDAALKAQLRSMKTPTWLAYAEQASNPNTIFYEQQKYLESYIADVATAATKPTSVLFRTDSDSVIRNWPDRPKNLPPLMSNALAPVDPAYADYQGNIRFLVPARAAQGQEEPVFANIPIDTFAMPMDADMRAGFSELVKGRYVLIGGDIIDNDQFDTPLSRFPDAITGQHETMIGLEVHAHMLAQQLDSAWSRPIAGPALWALAVLVVLAGGLTSLIDLRARWVALAFLGQMAFFVAFPFWLQGRGIDTTTLPTFGWAIGWLFGYAAVGTAARTIGSRQRAFAQSALGKYLPVDVAAQIMRDPDQLSLHGERRNIFCVFTDLEGFTKLSHAVTPETVARLLNEYLDRLSDIVLEHGGTIQIRWRRRGRLLGRAIEPPRRWPAGRRRRARHVSGGREISCRPGRRGRSPDRDDARGPPRRRRDRRQFRRRRAHPIHRARRQHEHRVTARGREQGAENRRADLRRGRRALGPRRSCADGPRHAARPRATRRCLHPAPRPCPRSARAHRRIGRSAHRGR